MSAAQRNAWFNLVVVLVSVALVIGLSVLVGWPKAIGGFGTLGLLGFGVLFYRRRGAQVVMDERDVSIQRRSIVLGYAVFWLAFVAACVSLPVVYGERGCVPVWMVASAVWWGVAIVYGVAAAATLVQYGSEGGDAS
ncbi:MAG TPA: hypothetical protein VGH33_04300 [Isosphaeraceae bacterium]|jgi:hypothetical protein